MSITAMPPCQAACPIRTDVRGYVYAISKGDVSEAIRIIREVNPFPSVCGRICTRACESACRRGQIDEPIAIASLKRFASDETMEQKDIFKTGPYYTEKIAIVGGGPSGLTAAHDLALLGYNVVVYEAHDELGGMMTRGVPEYRLPKNVVMNDIERILSLGVEARTNTALGKDITVDELMKEYQAVFIALGSEKSLFPKCRGIELPGVITAVEFLKQVSRGQRPYLGQKVVIIGGGHTAIDAARTCIRLGSPDVTVLYRRTINEMPAGRIEVEEAESEGVKFRYLSAPLEFIGRGRIEKIRCTEMRFVADESRRRRLVPVEDSEFEVMADAVILAIGYNPRTDDIKDIEKISGKRGTIVVKDDTGTTNLKGVFAGGDVVSGPMSVIDAIASGKRAAIAIHRYLRSLPPKENEEPTVLKPLDEKIIPLIEKRPQQKMAQLPVEERIKNFDEVNLGFTWEQAISEAQRCLNCGAGAEISDECVSCLNCVRVCPYNVPVASEYKPKIDISQCQACGICASECPALAIDIKLDTKEQSIIKLQNAINSAKNISGNNSEIEFYCQYKKIGKPGTETSKETSIGKPCIARIDISQFIKPFEEGCKKVKILACKDNDCHFKECNKWLNKHVNEAKRILKESGLDPEQLTVVYE
ncbi:MAG: FAD-dependent oxidoreductase [Nitrospirae bacterium]|jgi:NADPH-dependent glutamate synthase beta subunit-like oxidoreductase|nr:FAD-dependent oxidoreductase [Nitrospirota bacterium]